MRVRLHFKKGCFKDTLMVEDKTYMPLGTTQSVSRVAEKRSWRTDLKLLGSTVRRVGIISL